MRFKRAQLRRVLRLCDSESFKCENYKTKSLGKVFEVKFNYGVKVRYKKIVVEDVNEMC